MRLPLSRRPFLPAASAAHRGRTLLSLLTGLVLLAGAELPPAAADQWTDVSGQHTLEAEFLGLWGEKAVFALPDGQRKTVLLKNLQAESRLRALDLAEQRKARVEEIKAELAAIQEAERAPSAERIEQPSDSAPPYQAPPQDASLEAFVEHQMAQLRAGHLLVFWDSLPASYQKDLEELTVLYAQTIDQSVYEQQLDNLDRITRLLASREDWIFSHPLVIGLLGQVSQDENAARDTYRNLIGLVQASIDPEVASLERAKQGDLDGLMRRWNELAAGFVHNLMPLVEPNLPTGYKVTMTDENHGTIVAQYDDASGQAGRAGDQPGPGGSPEMYGSGMQPPGIAPGGPGGPGGRGGPGVKMVRVEGRWVDQRVADNWDKTVAETREQIEKLPELIAQYRGTLDAVNQWVNLNVAPLETAQSREAFHASLDPILADVMLKAMQARPRRGAATYGSGGYGEGGYGEDGYGEDGYGEEPYSEGDAGYGEGPDGGYEGAEGYGPPR